ncbi:peptidoglycan DD-metalloendopeptidase family protein [Candidatus Parcubacteria bacterium]|jgi:LysM repeat protein|nr:peptidoglycan DD-metalloendopeptidase family protein [Candidatus Parcubacteria bacterium]
MYIKPRKTIIISGIALFIFCGMAFYSIAQDNQSSGFVVYQAGNQNECFVDSRENCEIESPDLYLIQGNSIRGNAPVFSVTPQVLGSLGADKTKIQRKNVTECIVKQGDTISSIAVEFNISTDTILWANDLTKKSVLKVGKKLIILPVSGILHIVKSGNTLSEITRYYKANSNEIIVINDIQDNKIFIGDVLVIPGAKKPSSSYIAKVPSVSSYFIFPCEGRITQRLHWYNAVDVANKCGTPIYSTAGGTVQKTGYIRIGGNRVRIIHPNGIVTYYGHLSKILVSPGQKVSQGQIVGYMGRTGYATGCHVHYEVRGATNPLAKYALGAILKWK